MTPSSASDGWVNRDPSGHIDTRAAATPAADIDDDDDRWRIPDRTVSTKMKRRRRERWAIVKRRDDAEENLDI